MNQKGSVTPVCYMCNIIFILFQAISSMLSTACLKVNPFPPVNPVASVRVWCTCPAALWPLVTDGPRCSLQTPAQERLPCSRPASVLRAAPRVELPIPLVLSAQQGFLAVGVAARWLAPRGARGQACCSCWTFSCLGGPHPGEALRRRGREMDLAGRTHLRRCCRSPTQSCRVQCSF